MGLGRCFSVWSLASIALCALLPGCSFRFNSAGADSAVGEATSLDVSCPASLAKSGSPPKAAVGALAQTAVEDGSPEALTELWGSHCTYPHDNDVQAALDQARKAIQERTGWSPATEKAIMLTRLRAQRKLPGGELIGAHDRWCTERREAFKGGPGLDADPVEDALELMACGRGDVAQARAWFWLDHGHDDTALRAAAFIGCEDIDQASLTAGYLRYKLCQRDVAGIDSDAANRLFAEAQVGNAYTKLVMRGRWEATQRAMAAMGPRVEKDESEFPEDLALFGDAVEELEGRYVATVAPWQKTLLLARSEVLKAQASPGRRATCIDSLRGELNRYVAAAKASSDDDLLTILRDPIGYALTDSLGQCYAIESDSRAHVMRFLAVGAERSLGFHYELIEEIARRGSSPKYKRRSMATDPQRELTERGVTHLREPIRRPYNLNPFSPEGWTREVEERVVAIAPASEGMEVRFKRNVVMGEYEVGCRNDYGKPVQIDRFGRIHYEQTGCTTKREPVDLTLPPVIVSEEEGKVLRPGDMAVVTWKQSKTGERSKPSPGHLIRISRNGAIVWVAGVAAK